MSFRRVLVAIAAPLLILASSGCGLTDKTEIPSLPPVTKHDSPIVPAALRISMSDGPGTRETTWVLNCSPNSGSHPHPDEACQTLANENDALLPIPSGVKCLPGAHGPQIAKIDGRFGQDRVQVTISRDSDCGIVRWERLVGFLPYFDDPLFSTNPQQ